MHQPVYSHITFSLSITGIRPGLMSRSLWRNILVFSTSKDRPDLCLNTLAETPKCPQLGQLISIPSSSESTCCASPEQFAHFISPILRIQCLTVATSCGKRPHKPAENQTIRVATSPVTQRYITGAWRASRSVHPVALPILRAHLWPLGDREPLGNPHPLLRGRSRPRPYVALPVKST